MNKIQTSPLYGKIMGVQYDLLDNSLEDRTNAGKNVFPERLRVGDKVLILMAIFLKDEARTNVKGVVESIDGEYYLVRPMYYKHFVECYRCELEKIN